MILRDPNPPGTGEAGNPGPVTPPAQPLTTAAQIVLSDSPSELEELKKKLETESAARRKAELDALDAQATVQQLKEIDSRRPAPGKKKTVQFASWSPVETEEDDETQGEA